MATKKNKTDPPVDEKGGEKKPTLTFLLGQAGKAYGDTLQGMQRFAETYVLAVELYGHEAKKEFRNKYPLYTNAMWMHCEAIGKHNLLPHFWLASDTFIAGILRLENSMEKQLRLTGAMKDGKVETVDAEGKIVLKALDQLSRLDELGIMFAMNASTSPAEIRKFARDYRAEWKMMTSSKPDYERVGDLLRVNHAIRRVNRADWIAMGRLMGWSPT